VKDEEALLQGISADPDDDLPRLAYADWLEERGDLARARYAKFIRAQLRGEHGFSKCEYSEPSIAYCLPPDWAALDWGWTDESHDRKGIVAILHTPGARQRSVFLHFDCGFIWKASLGCDAFLGQAGALFARHPVRAVEICDRSPVDFGWGHGWYEGERHTVNEGQESALLPRNLWRLLTGWAAHPDSSLAYDGRLYTTRALAREALGRACLKYGRLCAREAAPTHP
jgi:uncharacterized protein (TIGR02996 family)